MERTVSRGSKRLYGGNLGSSAGSVRLVLGVGGLVLGGPVGVVEAAAFMVSLVPLFRVLVGPIETGLLRGSPYGG